jgi:hypothetical protein
MTTPVREEIEWVNFRWDHAPDVTRPRILLIGDSIANGYHGVVSDRLQERANIDLLATSKCVGDPALRRETRFAMEEYEYALIHFNNGLHGQHLADAGYESALRDYVRTLAEFAPESHLIWASSTPRRNAEGDLCPQRNRQVQSRNNLAAAIMAERQIPIDDLYSLVVDRPELFSTDGVHYNDEGRTFLGEAVAALILETLDESL